MKQKILNYFSKVFLLAVLSIVITVGAAWISKHTKSDPVTRLENSIYDLAFQVRTENKAHRFLKPEDVVIVDIDNASINELGRVQSWPRLYDAEVIKYLGSGSPLAIGIDFLYTESDSLPKIYKQILLGNGLKNVDHVLSALSTDDTLAKAIQEAQNVYLTLYEDKEKEINFATDSFSKSLRLFRVPVDPSIDFSKFHYPQIPIQRFRSVARGIGNINMPTDNDGVVRTYQFLKQLGPVRNDSINLLANLPVYMLTDLYGVNDKDIRLKNAQFWLTDSIHIPVNKTGGFRINWLGSSEQFRYIPFYKIYQKLIPADYFKNKVIFLGTSATGMEDLKTVPHSDDRMPGVEVHATAFLNIANQAFIHEYSFISFLPAILIMSLLMAWLFVYTRPINALLFLLAFLIIEFLGSMFLFTNYSIIIPIVALLGGTVITGMLTNTYNYFTERKQKKQLRNAFGTYVSSTVVNKILEDPKSLMLGGTKKVLSVLFSDIRGFTNYSEHMDPQLVVKIINKYLSAMSEPVLAHEGTIDKFIGDAIFAIFGAPLENSDHSSEACEVALEMMIKLKEVNKDLISEGYGPLKMGIGLNTGEMTIGNIGSSKRFDYTAIGDAVNLGSRIEGLTKHFNVGILASVFTKNACDADRFIFRALPETRVQGKQMSVGIFELLDFKANRSLYEPAISIWERAQVSFMMKNFESALALFREYQAIYPTDVPVEIYIHKCRAYQLNPEEFTNAIEMENK
ncbi:MAG: adenylate/guanylate cyclase domain-containing protein [Saprospiraceae bacterium]